MSEHYGNFRIYGKVISDAISGTNLVVSNVNANFIDVDSIVINGTSFDPTSVNVTANVDLSAVTSDISGLKTDVQSLSAAIDNINEESTVIESSGGSLTITNVGNLWNLEVVSISGGGGPVPPHNNLIGLQGGTSSQYYHLTSSEYSDYIGSSEVTDITGNLQAQITVNSGNILTNAANIASNAADIAILDTRVDSIEVSAGGGLPMSINSGLTSNYTVTETGKEVYVGFNTTSGARTVFMNASAAEGDKVYVKDEGINAFTNNITVDGNGNNVDCCATYSLNYNNAGVLFIFAGGQWRAMNN